MSPKNFYIFIGIVFTVFLWFFIFSQEVQAVITDCSQLNQATCQNPVTSYICYPQWCGGPKIDIDGEPIATEIWCKHRPCYWTGFSCAETAPGDETDALLKPCENQAIADCTLGWEHVDVIDVSQGWCILVSVDDECVAKKWCDWYKEKQYRKYYCQESGGVGDCGYTAPTPPGTVKEGEETCDCLHEECNPECVPSPEGDEYCVGIRGEGATCNEDCVCEGGEGPPPPPECPSCPPELQGGFVPCGRSCDDPNTDLNECESCQLCHFFMMLDRIVDFVLFTLVPIVAVLMLVIGGIMYIGAVFEFLPGGPELLGQAKRILTSVVLGLIVIFGAWLIINAFLTIIGIAEWTGLGNWFEITCP